MDDLAVGAAAEFIRLRYPWVLTYMEPPGFAIARGVAFDASLLYRTPIPNANIGVSLLNLGPDIEFTKGDFSSELPIELRRGISSTPVRNGTHKLMFGFDMGRVFEDPEQFTIHLGAEYTVLNIVSLRMGYLKGLEEFYIDRNGITFGFGIRIAGIFSTDVADMSNIFDPYLDATSVYLSGHLEVPFPNPRRPSED